jgi:predicted RNA-binding protein
MCIYNAYIQEQDKDSLYLESVEILKPQDGNIYLKNIYDEEKVFDGKLIEISFTRNKILLEKKK